MKSWTLSLYRQTQPFLHPRSFLRYREFLKNEPAQPTAELLTLRLKPPFNRTIVLRKWGSDPATFEEVFVDQVYRPVVENVGACRTIIDLGANIGLASIYLSAYLGCRCFCVEPNPETFGMLQSNLSQTDAGLLNAGVWSEETGLRTHCENGRFSMSSVSPDATALVRGFKPAEIIRRSGFESVDLLKIDIEGAEMELFRGDVSWLHSVRALAIEFHGDTRTATNFDSVMAAFGFRIVDGGHTTVAIKS